MNVQEANLADVLSAYYNGTRAATAAAHLQEQIEGRRHQELAVLLRHYRERPITDPDEMDMRAAVDDLMICCDVLEIGVLAAFLPPPDDSDFWRSIKTLLANPELRQYYATYYPLKLPQLLHRRLTGRHSSVETTAPDGAGLMFQFLALDHRFMATLNDGYLLRMLDSFSIGEYRFNDVVRLIASPQEFVRRITLPPEERSVPDQALYEFSLFVQFSANLHELLGRMAPYPLLQSEVWNHYGYWYGIIGSELNEQLSAALAQFLQWKPNGENAAIADEIREDVRQGQHVLAALTSGAYSRPVERLLAER